MFGKKRKGYNVIELLVVITAISLISAIGYKGVNILINNIKAEQLSSQLKQIEIGLANYYADTGTYPTKLSLLIKKEDPADATHPDEFDAVSVAFYGDGNGDAVVPEYWAGPYVNGMIAQDNCIKSVVGYEICFGAKYDAERIDQLYNIVWTPAVSGGSVKNDSTSTSFMHVLSINGVESEMAIKLFEEHNRRGISAGSSDANATGGGGTSPTASANRSNIIDNKDRIGVGSVINHEITKTIVYRFTDAF